MEYYLEFLASAADKMDKNAVKQNASKLFGFFLEVFDFRRATERKKDLDIDIDAVEDKAIDAFSSFVMKLSENTFKPFFVRLFGWSQERELDRTPTIARTTTFYRANVSIANKLKVRPSCDDLVSD